MSGRGQASAQTRFRKGQSGNPKGRPRKKADPPGSAFDIIVDRTLSLTRDGVSQEVGIEEALQHKTYQDALAGSRMARREILKMILKRERARAAKNPPPATKPEWRHEPEPKNANVALLLLGIAMPCENNYGPNDPYERLLRAPWVVETAFRRRRKVKISIKDLAEIKRCTHTPESVNWPHGVNE